MSHRATNWAISQRGLKPATRIVLWHLADCHNPHQGTFPSQKLLAEDCEMSRSALNAHLAILEARGLIRRVQRIDDRTKQQISTAYKLAFEDDFDTQDVVVPCPDSGQGSVSGKQPEPCPEKRESRVRNPDTNPVREPVKEPQEARERAPWEEDFSRFWGLWNPLHLPDQRHMAAGLFRNLPSDARAVAIDELPRYFELMRKRKKEPRMMPYLRNRIFDDLHDGPPFDGDGDFVIEPGRPEWSAWLGEIRARRGEAGVQSVVKLGYCVVKTRWPEPQKAQAAA